MSSLRERSLEAGPRESLWPASLFLNDPNEDLESTLTRFVPDLRVRKQAIPWSMKLTYKEILMSLELS